MINVLFVCRANVGRSQMAEALFKRSMIGDFTVSSAGTIVSDKDGVSKQGQKIGELASAKEVIHSLRLLGIEMAENERDQLTPRMVDAADVIVVMAEKETWPDFLKTSTKVIYWEIEDPFGKTQEETNRTRDLILQHVQELIAQLRQK